MKLDSFSDVDQEVLQDQIDHFKVILESPNPGFQLKSNLDGRYIEAMLPFDFDYLE